MCSKLHKDLGKPALLSLRLGKTKITKHNHVFYLNNTQLSGIEFTGDRTNGNDPHAVRRFRMGKCFYRIATDGGWKAGTTDCNFRSK